MATSQDLRLAVFLRVAAATGARRGEVCALRWTDINWTTPSVRFDEAIIAAEGGALLKAPKTRRSVRRIAIDSGTRDALRRLYETVQEVALDCGTALATDGFVFSMEPDGTVLPHPDPFSRGFRKICRMAGVADDIHLHSLRHFQSTVLDSVISESQKQARMGWTTVQMARHYTDVVSEEDRRASDYVGRVLDSEP